MKLSTDDYRLGVLWWDVPDVQLMASSLDRTDRGLEGPAVLVPTSGSVPRLPVLLHYRAVGFSSQEPIPPPYEVRWEFLDEAGILTALVWHDLGAPPTELRFVPNYGAFRRLVVATPLLEWHEDVAYRFGDAVIRLIHGSVVGIEAEPLDPTEIDAYWVPPVAESAELKEVSGRFIEIVAPGESEQHAELAAFALLGYVGLCLGGYAVGRVVFAEAYHARPGAVTRSISVPLAGRAAEPADPDSLNAFERALPAAVAAAADGGGMALALRWYGHAVRAASPIDQLVACFIGVEAVLTEFGTRNGPLPVVAKREEQYRQLLAGLGSIVPHDAAKGLRSRLKGLRRPFTEPSLPDYFDFYEKRRSPNPTLRRTFHETRSIRNDIFHGASVEVSDQQAAAARRLLVALLRRELGLPERLRLAGESMVLGVRFNSTLKTGQFVGGDEDGTD